MKPEQLKTLVKGEIGRNVIYREIADSTNTVAMELEDKEAIHGTVVIAESQTGGRGRMGRTWVSPPGGNIYLSVLLRPSLNARDAPVLTILAAVACCRALKDSTDLPIEIKWPNDLMISDKKVGGILTETKSMGGMILYAVLGIGINVNLDADHFPPEIRTIATSLRNETAQEFSRTILIANVLNELDSWYTLFTERGKQPLLDEWRRLSSTLGRPVEVTVGKEVVEGVAEDINGEGMLVLRLPSGTTTVISAGDVTHVR
jgi:BirA family biotin operon repressor/biotin-[acetyl-CoA-carboxylase] ligase